MSILISAPYGHEVPESGLLYLMGRYLAVQGFPVQQVACNGAFSSCDRDAEASWRRTVNRCFSCMQEQRALASWSEIPGLRLSNYLGSSDVQVTSRWINDLSNGELLSASYEDISLKPLVLGTFAHRFGIEAIDFNNKLHERAARTLMLSALRMLVAVERMIGQIGPQLVVLPTGTDFISRAFTQMALKMGIEVVTLKAESARRSVTLKRNLVPSSYDCPLLIEDVLSLRSDVKTWSPDLINLLLETFDFLGIVTESDGIGGDRASLA